MVSAALVAALGGCSAVKLGYATLPDFLYWWLDGYADFTDGQIPRLREELARLHEWHRANELPRLADALGRMEQLAPGPITPEQACTFVAEGYARLNAIAEQAEAPAAAIAATFKPAQLRYLERKFGKKNGEFRKERIEAPAEERLEKRYKQWADRMEMVYGSLEEPQRAVLGRALAQSIYDPARMLAEWQRRQVDLLQVLRRLQEPALDATQRGTLLRGWLQRLVRSPDEAYRSYQRAVMEEGCRIFAAVHETTSTEQRARAARRLHAYQRDLLELAGRP